MGLHTLREPGPGLFPAMVGVVLCALALPIVVRGVRGGDTPQPSPESADTWRRTWPVVVALAAYPIALAYLGFILGTLGFLYILFAIDNPRRRIAPLVTAAIAVAASYLVFGVLLGIPFPRGLWR
jgi:hypothetical protein